MSLKAFLTLLSGSPSAGKRRHIVRTAHSLLLAAFSMGLLVSGWTAAAQGPCVPPGCAASLGNGHGRGHGNERVWLRTWAFAGGPVEGADVKVSVRRLVLADAKKATNRYGVFPARVRNALELDLLRRISPVRISISGGTINGDPFSGHMMADVALINPARQDLVANPVTTLVSLLLDARPALTLKGAEARVRRFLQLPANYDLGFALRQSSGYASPFFSPVRLMEEAEAAGGLDAFESQLLQELLASPRATHPFRTPPQVAAASGSSPARTLQELLAARSAKHLVRSPRLLASSSDAASTPASTLTAGLYAAALDVTSTLGVENLFGWAMSLTGILPTPDTAQTDVDALVNALSDLQNSVSALQSQVSALTLLVKSTATLNEYNTIVTAAQPLAVNVTAVESDISTFASSCSPLYAGQDSNSNPNQEWCNTWYPIFVSELQMSFENKDFENLEAYISDNGTLGTEGMLHLYSLWLGESKQFFRAADSTKMQNLYDYWDGVLTSAANLRLEYFHLLGDQNSPAGQQQIIAFIGDVNAPPSNLPPSVGTFQLAQATNLSLMWPPVPTDPNLGANGGVVIETVDHTMWALDPWVQGSGTTPFGGGVPAIVVPACYLWPGTGYQPTVPNMETQSGKEAQQQSYLGFGSQWTLDPATVAQIFPGCAYDPINGSLDSTGCWLNAPLKAQFQNAALLAPTITPMSWQQWFIQQTETDDYKTPPSYDEMPSSAGFFNTATMCPGQGSPFSGAVGTSDGLFILLNPNSPTTSSNSFQTVDGAQSVFVMPIRTLSPGEQYFWYQ